MILSILLFGLFDGIVSRIGLSIWTIRHETVRTGFEDGHMVCSIPRVFFGFQNRTFGNLVG